MHQAILCSLPKLMATCYGLDFCYGSKPEKLNPSRCFLLYLQKLTYLPTDQPGHDAVLRESDRRRRRRLSRRALRGLDR